MLLQRKECRDCLLDGVLKMKKREQLTNEICNFYNIFVRGVIVVAISVIVGGILMIGSYHLPTNLMFNNVKKSIPLFTIEGLYPSWAGLIGRKNDSARLDNYSDAVMLSTAIYPTSKSKIKDAMLNPSYKYKNRNPVQSLIGYLKKTKKFTIFYYPRYWHGYLIVLKPLIMVFDIAYIRLLNMLLQMIVVAYLTTFLGCAYGKGYGLSLFLSYLLLNPVSLSMSFHYSSVFYVTSLISIFLLKKMKLCMASQNVLYLFLLSGILTAFFDLLTYPIASLGIPLVIYLIALNYNHKLEEPNIAVRNVVFPSVFWGIGYAGMHIGKWLLAWQLTGHNVVSDALSQLTYRMSHHTVVREGGNLISPIKAITNNFQVILHNPIIIVLGVVLLLSLWKLLKKIKTFTKVHDYCILRYSLSFVMLYPFIWYAVFCNHSFVHIWFTYRSFSVFTFAVGSIVTSFFLEYCNLKSPSEGFAEQNGQDVEPLYFSDELPARHG